MNMFDGATKVFWHVRNTVPGCVQRKDAHEGDKTGAFSHGRTGSEKSRGKQDA